MPSLKKGIFYVVLFFIIVWMFVLGIFVGRGNAPVKFDTRGFQKKLADISGKYDAQHHKEQETDIQFYEDLQSPMSKASDMPENRAVVTRKIDNLNKGGSLENNDADKEDELDRQIPLKLSQKFLTKAKYAAKSKEKISRAKIVSKPATSNNYNKKDKYTIQIAAFKDMKTAFEKIASLKAKGYTAYRTLGKVQSETWHRIRIGHFSDTEVARKYLRKLKHDNINGIIIKQDL
jgi:cell division protein FtsN